MTTGLRSTTEACQRKHQFLTKDEAKAESVRMRTFEDRVHVYKCDHCRMYHIGRVPPEFVHEVSKRSHKHVDPRKVGKDRARRTERG